MKDKLDQENRYEAEQDQPRGKAVRCAGPVRIVEQCPGSEVCHVEGLGTVIFPDDDKNRCDKEYQRRFPVLTGEQAVEGQGRVESIHVFFFRWSRSHWYVFRTPSLNGVM